MGQELYGKSLYLPLVHNFAVNLKVLKIQVKEQRKTGGKNQRLIVTVAPAPSLSNHHPQSPLSNALFLSSLLLKSMVILLFVSLF